MRSALVAAATLALFATILSAPEANAQARRPTPTPTPSSSPWADPMAPGSAAAPPATSQPVSTMANAPAGAPATYRPEEKSIGIGAGYAIGSGAAGELLWNPNVVSARFRMASGLTIEPIAGIVIDSTTSKVDTAKTSSTGLDLFAGANIRKPFWSRSQADAVFIIGGDFSVNTDSSKDAGGGKTSSTGFGLGASYGLGVEFWPRTHWSLSFDAVNSLLSFTSSSSKDPAGVKTSSTGITLSPQWDPAVRLMTHLYY